MPQENTKLASQVVHSTTFVYSLGEVSINFTVNTPQQKRDLVQCLEQAIQDVKKSIP